MNRILVCSLLSCATFAGSIRARAASAGADGTDIPKITDLKCEYATDPIGLDIRSPQLSWRMESEGRGVLRVRPAGSSSPRPKTIWHGTKAYGTAERRKSSRSSGIRYEGPALQSRTEYFWKVKVQCSDGRQTGWSDAGKFETGLMDESDWHSDWIAYAPGSPGRVLYFKGTHVDARPVAKARAVRRGTGLL